LRRITIAIPSTRLIISIGDTMPASYRWLCGSTVAVVPHAPLTSRVARKATASG
jgi:hypothetical protein